MNTIIWLKSDKEGIHNSLYHTQARKELLPKLIKHVTRLKDTTIQNEFLPIDFELAYFVRLMVVIALVNMITITMVVAVVRLMFYQFALSYCIWIKCFSSDWVFSIRIFSLNILSHSVLNFIILSKLEYGLTLLLPSIDVLIQVVYLLLAETLLVTFI